MESMTAGRVCPPPFLPYHATADPFRLSFQPQTCLSLFLQSISLFQFKNYAVQSYRFSERIVGICGQNGMGKTNLLDGIHYLCFTKSYFSRSDAQNVHH